MCAIGMHKGLTPSHTMNRVALSMTTEWIMAKQMKDKPVSYNLVRGMRGIWIVKNTDPKKALGSFDNYAAALSMRSKLRDAETAEYMVVTSTLGGYIVTTKQTFDLHGFQNGWERVSQHNTLEAARSVRDRLIAERNQKREADRVAREADRAKRRAEREAKRAAREAVKQKVEDFKADMIAVGLDPAEIAAERKRAIGLPTTADRAWLSWMKAKAQGQQAVL